MRACKAWGPSAPVTNSRHELQREVKVRMIRNVDLMIWHGIVGRWVKWVMNGCEFWSLLLFDRSWYDWWFVTVAITQRHGLVLVSLNFIRNDTWNKSHTSTLTIVWAEVEQLSAAIFSVTFWIKDAPKNTISWCHQVHENDDDDNEWMNWP